MTELETLLLQQLQQQQHDSEQLVTGLSEQLDRLRSELSNHQQQNDQLRAEIAALDDKNTRIFNDLTTRIDYLTDQLERFTNVQNRIR